VPPLSEEARAKVRACEELMLVLSRELAESERYSHLSILELKFSAVCQTFATSPWTQQ
jgi:hypothetical protein